ncbi:DEAD/DEAH box helicase [Virgibacillus sp. SK37]|uniref:DEAD/DEAH box helicase n=1 Tax=Virgibacillus sp. SK37 TaxID=403957 RepID=UPI0004D17F9D|nr:DEAD/DEAH box helicase family protein [Virgibacillus sp. SK37]AIF45164.1 hypothetical protein X953_03255 [Virgibacillus sp. SK37]
MELINFLDNRIQDAVRPYQLDALDNINRYLYSDSNKQALIKMPMGTGKTVIIAIAAAFFPHIKNCLVVTSSSAVKEQLIKDIKIGVWSNLSVPFCPIKPVVELLPSDSGRINTDQHPTIYVCTVQSLLRIKQENNSNYNLLKNKLDLVIFDEGHKEPAQQWQATIRELEAKVVLFSATPVRNDLNKFSIDNQFVFTYSFIDAVNQGYVKDVIFSIIDSTTISNSQRVGEFVSYINNSLESYVNEYDCDRDEVKVIIRCNTDEEIEMLVDELNNRGLKAKGVHEKFAQANSKLLQNVPSDLRSDDTVCWVHQYKLVEGIDNYKFCILGIYQALPDPRSFVQQVGRVIRKRNIDINQSAKIIVWDHQDYQLQWWDSYFNYERAISDGETDTVFSFSEYFSNLLTISPSVMYLNKKYLKRYSVEEDINNLFKLEKYQLPKKTNIYESHLEEFDINSVFTKTIDAIHNELILRDNNILDKIVINENHTVCFIYAHYYNSPYLTKEVLLEQKIGILIFRIIEKTLFLYDTTNFTPEHIKEEWKRISALKLKKLFDRDTSFSSATIQNGSINFNHFNRMVLYSDDIAQMAPSISDQYNFLTTVQSKKSNLSGQSSLRRYVGFSNARISQASTMTRLDLYIDWLDQLYHSLYREGDDHTFFQRYAPVTDIPEETEPVSILLQFEGNELIQDSVGTLIELDSNFYRITDRVFYLKYMQEEYEVEITFNTIKGEYNLQFRNEEDEPDIFYGKQRILNWLNDNQSFQLLLNQNEYRYFKGYFYKLGVPRNYGGLLNYLDENSIQLSARTKINEKGKFYKDGSPQPNTAIWDKNSLFYLVAKKGININNNSKLKRLLQDSDYVICTDLNSEIADFITVSESTNTVCFIHCKAGKSKLSASAFQEVCGQILKNLDYVNDVSNRLPVDLERWNGIWTHRSYRAVVNRRIINPDNISSEDIWNKLKEIQTNPDSTTNVIALVGDAFSKETYDRESRKPWGRQKPEKIQIDYILLETALAVERSQAKFLVSYTKKV